MGKKGHGWFSAIKKVFTSNSKDKQPPPTNNEGDKVSSKQKKGGGIGRLKSRSLFIPPLFREPSSIEKILGEIDQQNIFIAHPPPPLQQAQPSSSYSGRPVTPTPPLQQPQAQPSSSYSGRPVSPTPSPQQSQVQPSSTSARPVSPPQQQQAQPSSSTSARPVSPPQQPQAQPSSSTSARPVSPPQQPQAQPSSSTSAKHVSSPPPPQQSKAQPSSSYSERPLSPPPQQSQAQLSSSSARPVSPHPPQVIAPPKSGIKTPPPSRFVHSQTQISRRPKPTLQQQHLSAIRIQAAYRGHMVRRNVKGVTGLVRLQGVIRGQNVKRQTVNAMKQMQLLVRVQTQIQSRRIQTLENQALKRQANNNNDKRSETSLGNKRSEMGDEYWDYSSITKEERDARSQKKVEAVIGTKKALAYAYLHQVRKGTPTSAQNSLMDIRTGGYPWWWNWLDHQLPNSNTPQPLKNLLATTPSRSRTPDDKRTHKQLDRLDSPSTPMSSRSMAPLSRSRTPPNQMMKYSRASRGGGSPYSMKDDDSLMSCPQSSSVPNYMSPTVSAKAKARPTTSSNSMDRVTPSTPGSKTSKKRFSFPFTPKSNKWKKSQASIGGMSMDSSISVSSSVWRKPFNRFV